MNKIADINSFVRYSDVDLGFFKAIIQRKIDEATTEYNYWVRNIANTDNNGTNDGGTYKSLEDGSATFEKEYAGTMAVRQQKFLESLKFALIRIENKTYGICRSTGKLIPKERLMIVPHATLSMEAKMLQQAS